MMSSNRIAARHIFDWKLLVQKIEQRIRLSHKPLSIKHIGNIKPLGKLFRNLQGIGGSTILGTGEVALILDVQALIDSATRTAARHDGPVTRGHPAESAVG